MTILRTTRIGAGKLILWLAVLVGFVLLSACSSELSDTTRNFYPLDSGIDQGMPTASLLPPYIATEQNAQAGARATQMAAQAAGAEAQIAQAYLLVTQTSASLAMTSAAATEEHFTRQTQQAVGLTQTSQSAQATATQQALYVFQTTTAHAEETQNALATQTVSARLTGTAWPQTATPLAATQSAIVAQAQDTERWAYWRQYVIPFWVSIGAVTLVVFLTLCIVAYRQLMPALELRLRTRRGADGETLILLDQSHKVNILQPGRSFGAALLNKPDDVQVAGLAPVSPEWQDRVTGREQAVQLAKVLPPDQRKTARRLLARPEQPALPAGRANAPEIRVLPPEDPGIRPLLDEAERKLLGEGDE